MKRRLLLQRLGLAVTAGAIGAAMNVFAPTSRLLPGRIVTLPIAILFGPAFGGVAAMLGALPFARLYPVFLVILGAEGLLTGAFARRGRSSLISGAFVWIAVAAAMVIQPDWFGVGNLGSATGPIALQQLLNAMLAVVIAELIAVVVAVGQQRARAEQPPRLRAYAFHVFVLVAILPILLLSAVNGELFAARQESDGAARLREDVAALGDHIDAYMTNHVHAVQAIAAAIPAFGGDSAKRQALIEQNRRIYDGFIRTFITDPAGLVTESDPPLAAESQNSTQDRAYFIEARQTGVPAIST